MNRVTCIKYILPQKQNLLNPKMIVPVNEEVYLKSGNFKLQLLFENEKYKVIEWLFFLINTNNLISNIIEYEDLAIFYINISLIWVDSLEVQTVPEGLFSLAFQEVLVYRFLACPVGYNNIFIGHQLVRIIWNSHLHHLHHLLRLFHLFRLYQLHPI